MKKKYNARFQYIALAALKVDYGYQRRPTATRVKKLAREYDPHKVGVVSVAQRGQSGFFVIDGQHRILAAKDPACAVKIESVPCWVYEVSGIAEEAALFKALNDSAKVQALDEFKASVVSGDDAEAAKLDSIVRALGWKIGWAPGEVSCVKALRRSFRMPHGEHAVKSALTACKAAYGEPPIGEVFEGLARVFARYNGTIEPKRMSDVLASRVGGQARLRGDGRTLADVNGSRVAEGVAEAIRNTYNKGLRANRLPSMRND